ncbi:MAG TPA: isochorismatase family protein [Nitrososphaerales archaeon]|nr:isochorismatase family protein [Nitrososphaerales archaeon]
MDYSGVIPESDLEGYRKAGFGKRMGFGKKPCIIVIDLTYGFVDPKNLLAHGSMGFEAVKNLVPLLEKARSRGVPIIYTTGLNSISNTMPIGISRKVVVNPRPGENDIVEEIKPHAQDIVVPKGKASIFFGTTILTYLNRNGIDTLIIAGATTSGCVRGTVVEAASYDYYVVIPEECVADRAEVPHKVNLFDMEMKYADVIPTSEVLSYLDSLPGKR